jgi:trans-aconitate methyltransferase
MRPISQHNSFYLSEDRRQEPKEYFKFLMKQAATRLASTSVRVLDVGCAAGDFLYYLQSLYPEASVTGIDVSPEFIAKAKENMPGATFMTADIYSGENLPAGQFDVVFMSGVNYLYPEYESWLRNILALTSQKAYIFGVFNPEDLDVRATVQRAGDKTSATPWNLISRSSISRFLNSLGARHEFVAWEVPMSISRSQDDPIRSWTIEDKQGKFLVVNGTQILHHFALLEIAALR